MGHVDRGLRVTLGPDRFVERKALCQKVLSPGEATYLRGSLADAVTAILLHTDVLRRQLAEGSLQPPALESATEQISASARQIWRVVETAVLEPMT